MEKKCIFKHYNHYAINSKSQIDASTIGIFLIIRHKKLENDSDNFLSDQQDLTELCYRF